MEWFEDWFNTEEYLDVYRHRNEADAKQLVALILKNINLPPKAKILDMACGAGRHSILFAQKGYPVTAVDLSQNLLEVAGRSASEAQVNVNFIRSDLRNFSINYCFDLVLNLFTSFGYFKSDFENFKIFNNIFHHLNIPGYFVLDFFNRCYVLKTLVKKSVDQIPGGEIIQERSIEGERVIKRITIRKQGTERHYMESVRMYSSDELLGELKKIGFDIKNIFGDFMGNDFNRESSPRLIVIAGK